MMKHESRVHEKIDLMTHKTVFCTLDEHKKEDGPYYLECPYYHSYQDRRRDPGLHRPTFIGYGYDDNSICINWVEHIYHPHNYLTAVCAHPHCPKKYCPKIHGPLNVNVSSNSMNGGVNAGTPHHNSMNGGVNAGTPHHNSMSKNASSVGKSVKEKYK